MQPINYPVMYNNVYMNTNNYHRNLLSNFSMVIERRQRNYMLTKLMKSPVGSALKYYAPSTKV